LRRRRNAQTEFSTAVPRGRESRAGGITRLSRQ
jgi:hypothetical protein